MPIASRAACGISTATAFLMVAGNSSDVPASRREKEVRGTNKISKKGGNMKIVINNDFGGFSLSPLAVKCMAEMNGKECYFFDTKLSGELDVRYTPISIEDADRCMMWVAFSVKDPVDFLLKEERGKDGTYNDFNAEYKKISLSCRPENRADPLLVQVVEELGAAANGSCASLKVVEIPDGVDWEIDEYDGSETIAEKHRSWG
jgi:hypothetical protein